MRSAQFQIVGTEMAPEAQGQIGARVYRLDGALTIQPAALELQPWDDPLASGPEPDIDARGDFVVVGSAVYVRANTFNAWQMATESDPSWGLYADINPATWQGSQSLRILGEASINGTATWVLQVTNSFDRQFKAWIGQKDSYPLRYTAAWVNAKGSTYYINALYRKFNTVDAITAPDMSNRGIVGPGVPVALPSGSVTVTDVEFDCSGTTFRRPAPNEKFVLITLAFADTGPGAISISPGSWRIYGNGVNGAAPVDTGSPALLRAQTIGPGNRVVGVVAFELAQEAYQLWTVGRLTGATAVVSTFLPILPDGTSPCG
jgi:hypothetical protein